MQIKIGKLYKQQESQPYGNIKRRVPTPPSYTAGIQVSVNVKIYFLAAVVARTLLPQSTSYTNPPHLSLPHPTLHTQPDFTFIHCSFPDWPCPCLCGSIPLLYPPWYFHTYPDCKYNGQWLWQAWSSLPLKHHTDMSHTPVSRPNWHSKNHYWKKHYLNIKQTWRNLFTEAWYGISQAAIKPTWNHSLII